MAVRFPKPLRKGDQVAVVSPAGPVRNAEGLERGMARLRRWGLVPVCTAPTWRGPRS